MGHGQFGGRLLLPDLAVDANGEGVGIDLDAGLRVVERHIGLATAANVAHRQQLSRDGQPVGQAVLDRLRRRNAPTSPRRRPAAPNIGRGSTGCGVGMEAFASPIAAQAIIPPLITACGRTPKNAGSHSTRSASLPTSTEPISPSSPCAMAGQIVYFAI